MRGSTRDDWEIARRFRDNDDDESGMDQNTLIIATSAFMCDESRWKQNNSWGLSEIVGREDADVIAIIPKSTTQLKLTYIQRYQNKFPTGFVDFKLDFLPQMPATAEQFLDQERLQLHKLPPQRQDQTSHSKRSRVRLTSPLGTASMVRRAS